MRSVWDINNVVKLTSRIPTDVVVSANSLLPKHLKGLVVYNSEARTLESKDADKVCVVYDPIHGVLEIKY
jgi:hypothetical protein